jgi:hypothetical protein
MKDKKSMRSKRRVKNKTYKRRGGMDPAFKRVIDNTIKEGGEAPTYNYLFGTILDGAVNSTDRSEIVQYVLQRTRKSTLPSNLHEGGSVASRKKMRRFK